MGLAFNTA